ncbi:thioredoxin H1-like [Musa acuminata AAA Group]|uniref:thioredoxin H1-like n=1 Tax=Musa acuminata AAA Group TaxID=214697 RepID=UPI0031D82B93
MHIYFLKNVKLNRVEIYQTAASLVGSKDLSGLQVVVDFTSSWCGPCRMIAPFFAELANKFTDAIFLRVDVNELKRVALDCAIETLPTFIFLRQGNIVDRVVGARKDLLPKKIELHMRN